VNRADVPMDLSGGVAHRSSGPWALVGAQVVGGMGARGAAFVTYRRLPECSPSVTDLAGWRWGMDVGRRCSTWRLSERRREEMEAGMDTVVMTHFIGPERCGDAGSRKGIAGWRWVAFMETVSEDEGKTGERVVMVHRSYFGRGREAAWLSDRLRRAGSR
jgi:hypothetical protein